MKSAERFHTSLVFLLSFSFCQIALSNPFGPAILERLSSQASSPRDQALANFFVSAVQQSNGFVAIDSANQLGSLAISQSNAGYDPEIIVGMEAFINFVEKLLIVSGEDEVLRTLQDEDTTFHIKKGIAMATIGQFIQHQNPKFALSLIISENDFTGLDDTKDKASVLRYFFSDNPMLLQEASDRVMIFYVQDDSAYAHLRPIPDTGPLRCSQVF